MDKADRDKKIIKCYYPHAKQGRRSRAGTMQHIKTITQFEKMHFAAQTITVDRNGVDILSHLGFNLTDTQIARISGAPTASTVTVIHHPDDPNGNAPTGIYFQTENKTYIDSVNLVGIFVADPSLTTFGLYLEWIDFLETAPKSMAARMLAVMLRQAWKIPGLENFSLLAAGGRGWGNRDNGKRWGGFYAWPKYGFDMPLADENKEILPHFLNYPPKLNASATKILA